MSLEKLKKMFKRQQPIQRPQRQIQQKPKKSGCKIKFKKTAQGEEMSFSPECKAEQIEMAKRMREEQRENGEI